ncbi:MAG: Nitrogen regulation protein NR(I) [Syntrophorhabdus sp. PtaU1.Bin153]|nr:MAG: Nitrogen regulation protein NR(I) [Syntrophorhabdus sp. PtaU1.Bin153]
MSEARILIVDDEPSALELLEVYLSEKGYQVSCAINGSECIRKVACFNPEIIILDIRLPDADGLDILKRLREEHSTAQVIIITAFHDMATTIKAMKLGAFEYIPKPIDVDELEGAIRRALELSKTRTSGLIIGSEGEFQEGEIIGKTKEMKEIFKTIGILSGNRVNVLIEGETGTGKELVAKAIHYNSPYKDQPFIAINCSAIVENLLESELFGHEKGAFTGAIAAKKGKFEIAGEGTILLDEVGEIPFDLQAKLLRFLQNKEFQRVGGEKTLKSSARVIAATNRNLLQMVKDGLFREDLYYRLSVATVQIPPLRKRKADIPAIIQYLVRKIDKDLHKNIEQVGGRALQRMIEYEWPGNVRELENVLTRAAMYMQGNVLLDTMIAPLLQQKEIRASEGAGPERENNKGSRETERERIVRALQEARWHYGNACKALGISRPTLSKRLKEYGISPKPRNYPRND